MRVVIPVKTTENVVRFTLGGLTFEYDLEKKRKNIEKHGIFFRALRVYFSIMTALNSTMLPTARMKTAMIRVDCR